MGPDMADGTRQQVHGLIGEEIQIAFEATDRYAKFLGDPDGVGMAVTRDLLAGVVEYDTHTYVFDDLQTWQNISSALAWLATSEVR